MNMNWTGERLETFLISGDSVEHLHRNAITLDNIKDKVESDVAYGEGFGSHLMSKIASDVYSVDIDENTIKTAR
jgi:protein-L-isoaspartate O-methyltransferase